VYIARHIYLERPTMERGKKPWGIPWPDSALYTSDAKKQIANRAQQPMKGVYQIAKPPCPNITQRAMIHKSDILAAQVYTIKILQGMER
jgi:hypothetical protein